MKLFYYVKVVINIKSNISANTLFHFTNNKENLLNILINGFYPRCCIENVDFFFKEKYRNGFAPTEIAIPMVCFCDIPLSQIETHVKSYGGYALGLTKEWGICNGINPVMYESPETNPIRTVRESLDKTIKYLLGQYFETEEANKLNSLSNELIFFMCYLKPYEGKKWNDFDNKFDGELLRFYDEREWRYIPDYYDLREKNVKQYLTKNDYLDTNIRTNYNCSLKNAFKLIFTSKDIKYIIVEKEEEVLDLIRDIEIIKRHYSEDERKLLITKILSLDRLKEDF